MGILILNRLAKYKTYNVTLQINLDEFKVRDHKLNPILKNTLFEMMNKDYTKRL
jgi:hypothetical protein